MWSGGYSPLELKPDLFYYGCFDTDRKRIEIYQ